MLDETTVLDGRGAWVVRFDTACSISVGCIEATHCASFATRQAPAVLAR